MFNNSKKIIILINFFIILLIIALPYYLFGGKLYIGGDDTRLLYVYPWEFLKNISFFSWYNFSSVGSFNPNQFTVPFTVIWSLLEQFIKSKIIVDYFSFSLPLLLGYIYFQKLLSEILMTKRYKPEIIIGGLMYIFSPILILNQLSVFLYSVWLIALLPIISYYFLRYLRFEQKADILKVSLYSVWLSLALFSIPWLLGFVLPVGAGLLFSVRLYKKREIIYFIKKSLVFFIFVVFLQLFWLLPFSMTFLGGGSNSFGGNVLSQRAADTFSATVLSTASGNVLFPFINLFHRQIAFDYNWGLKSVYEGFYDKVLFINVIYILLFFGGVFFAKNILNKTEIRKFITFLIAFIFSLFLFTVNIGPLKQVFLWLGFIPGMVMFRNFYDKFALGYTLLFALVMTYSLVIIGKRFPQHRYLFACITSLIIFLNFIPIKDTIVRPLWKTADIYSNISIPTEYTNFMYSVSTSVPASSNMLTLPYNIAAYSIIKDTNSDNVFAGTSPVKIFSGINDFSGYLSFPAYEAGDVDKYFKDRDYKNLQVIFRKYNISYLFVTKNVPQEVKDSYLFNKTALLSQDDNFIRAITDKKLLTSASNNYELYSLKQKQSTLQPQNVTYIKINPATYQLHISHMKFKQNLIFLDSYHKQWKLYPSVYQNRTWCKGVYPTSKNHQECISNLTLFNSNVLSFFFQNPLFTNTHIIYNQRNNQWTIDEQTIKTLGNAYYKNNSDGTIDAEFILYFLPQSYFYLGAIISILTIIILSLIVSKQQKSYENIL